MRVEVSEVKVEGFMGGSKGLRVQVEGLTSGGDCRGNLLKRGSG